MKNADPGNRLIAFIIDSVIIQLISFVTSIPILCGAFVLIPLIFNAGDRPNANWAFFYLIICCVVIFAVVVQLAISFAYYIWYPVKKWNGATYGKKLMGIRIVEEDGSTPTIVTMLLREVIGKMVSGSVFYLGYIWVFIDEEGRAWHDIIFKTRVVEIGDRR